MLAGGINRYIVNNTIYDVDSGINTPGGSLYIVNNKLVVGSAQAVGSGWAWLQ
jgi:hypothetical protein